jgi:hypothetical protein
LKNWFFDKKNILNPDFSTITVVGNWKKSNNASFDFVFKRGGQHVIHPVCNKKRAQAGESKQNRPNKLA